MTNARIHRDFTPSGKLQHLSQWAHSCLAVPQRPAMLSRYETGLSPRSRTFRTNFCNDTGFPNYRDHRVPFVVWQPAFRQVAADSTTEPKVPFSKPGRISETECPKPLTSRYCPEHMHLTARYNCAVCRKPRKHLTENSVRRGAESQRWRNRTAQLSSVKY